MFEKLKELREYEGLTQKDIAKILNVSRSTYAGWECGKDIIPLQRLNELANFYHTTLDYLVGNSPTPELVEKMHKIDAKQVSKNLREFREKRNITQEEFALSINSSQASVHKYETGKTLITTSYALEFSKHYHYSLDELVGRKKNN